jgi:hypothetical protein
LTGAFLVTLEVTFFLVTFFLGIFFYQG